MKFVLKSEAGGMENQDRAVTLDLGGRALIVVADGAGGIGGGREAAMLAVRFLTENAGRLVDANSCAALLVELDRVAEGDRVAGETTCAFAVVSDGVVFGASVGDSGIWLVRGTVIEDLTSRQVRKPLVGSGAARPVSFAAKIGKGDRLLAATDGLLKYAGRKKIAEICDAGTVEVAAEGLIESVRLGSGGLSDDVTVVVAEIG